LGLVGTPHGWWRDSLLFEGLLLGIWATVVSAVVPATVAAAAAAVATAATGAPRWRAISSVFSLP
jgi:hypothetical protein